MNNFSKEEINTIKQAIKDQIFIAEDNLYIESKRHNERSVKRIESYIEELEEIYKKLIEESL